MLEVGTEDVAMQDRDAVRKQNAEDLKKAWKRFIKKQEARRRER